ncbi:retrotransposon hobase [Colletotrichum incanum]|nr:retrotransposon hobase [Colletotrichum incanum]
MTVASDASFADNSIDRKSSQAFAIKLFGGLIGWRANKQQTVTTSTTEAELLALSQAAKEAIFASRLITELSRGEQQLPTAKVTIQCDNQQTIRLVTRELVQLQTRLRHVDIHHHWLRQEIAEGRIDVAYTPSAELMADGLTKALPRQKWPDFLQQLGLTDQSQWLARNREDELKEDESPDDNLNHSDTSTLNTLPIR